jgi:hypothetical protein
MERDAELQRLKDENAELKKRVVDFSMVENAKKKLELKVEQLEQKVGLEIMYCLQADTIDTDGYHDSRQSVAKGK